MKIDRIGCYDTILNKSLQSRRFNHVHKLSNDTVSFGNSKDISIVGKRFLNNIKIIFSDVDGTISPHSDLMSNKTIDAIEFVRGKKVPFILTTARCYKDTLPIVEQLGHKPDYTIILQGGGVVDKNGKAIFENSISHESGRELIKWFKAVNNNDKNTHLIIYFDEEAYAESNIRFPWKARCQVNPIDSFDRLFSDNKKIQKAVIYKTQEACGEHNSKILLDMFDNSGVKDLAMKTSGRGFYELQNEWVSKDKAIDFILNRLGIEPKYAMAIGDSYNDIEMLDFIKERNGLAIAMGNANEKIKTHANAITSSINDEGFFNAINHIFTEK